MYLSIQVRQVKGISAEGNLPGSSDAEESRMNWNAIGAVGEVAGAIAVVATLVYLTIQLRINTKSIVSSNSNNLMQGFNTFNASLYGDEEATRIFYDGLESPDTLSLTERRRFLTINRTNACRYPSYDPRHWHRWCEKRSPISSLDSIIK